MTTKKMPVISTIISLCIVVTFLFAAPAWSKHDGNTLDIKNSTEKSLVDREARKGEGKSKNKVKRKMVKKVAVGAAVGVATKKATSGLKDSVKDVVE